MKIVQARDVTANLKDLTPRHFASAIVQKRAPGAYVYTFGRGELAVEAIVSFLLSNTTMPGMMQKNIDALGEALLDNGRLRSAFDRLFPSMTQSLGADQNAFSVNDIQDAHAKVFGTSTVSGIVSAMTEITVEAFSGTRFVSRSEGYAFREIRETRFPTANDLIREFLRAELIAVLRAEPLRIRVDARKFNPMYLFSEFSKVCNRLGRMVTKIGYSFDALHDAMYVVYTGLVDRGGISTRLPEEVVKSGEFEELSSNLTFVAAALSVRYTKAREGDWSLKSAMAKVIQTLNLSDRYDVVTLATAVGHMRYSPVVDPRSNLLGGVLSFAAPIKHETKVALFHKQTSAVPVMQAIPLERYTDTFSALISPAQGWDPLSLAHDMVESIVSVARLSELDDEPRSTLFSLAELTPLDALHLAAYHADRVYLPKASALAATQRGVPITLDERIVFEKNLHGKRLFADSIPFEGVVYTSSPSTLLLCCDRIDPDLTYDLSSQSTPEMFWISQIINTPAEVLWDYNGGREVQVEVGGSTLTTELQMTELTRNMDRPEARMVDQPLTGAVLDSAFRAIHEAREWVSEQPASVANPAIIARLDAQVGHHIHSMYEKLGSSEIFNDVLESVIRRLAKSVSPALRDSTYMTMEQQNYRLQVSAALVGYIYERLQLLPVKEGDILTVHELNLALWSRTDFFNRMIGTARAHR